MEVEPPRTPPRDPRDWDRMRQRLRELEGRVGHLEGREADLEGEKGELERENTLIKALLPPLSPAAQALISLAAGTPGGLAETLRRRGVRALRLERQAAQDVHDVQGGPDRAQGRGAISPSGASEKNVETQEDSFPRDKLGMNAKG